MSASCVPGAPGPALGEPGLSHPSLLAAHDWTSLFIFGVSCDFLPPPHPCARQRSRVPGDLTAASAPGDLWRLSELSFGFPSAKMGIKVSLRHVPRGLGDAGRVQ